MVFRFLPLHLMEIDFLPSISDIALSCRYNHIFLADLPTHRRSRIAVKVKIPNIEDQRVKAQSSFAHAAARCNAQ